MAQTKNDTNTHTHMTSCYVQSDERVISPYSGGLYVIKIVSFFYIRLKTGKTKWNDRGFYISRI